MRIALVLMSVTLLSAGPSVAQAGPVSQPVVHAAPAAPQPGADLPILGLAQVTFRVSDLHRSRAFYGGVLGLPAAFDIRDKAGKIVSAYYKVNDEQFIELVPGLRPGDSARQVRLVVQASNLEKLRATYLDRGLAPGAIGNGPDGNPGFRIVLPNGFPIDFLQYADGSRQSRLRGKLLTSARVSTHLLHAGTMVGDDDTRAFYARLGWGRMLPGSRGDYIETPSTDRNLETKNPPLDPDNPVTRRRYEQEVSGAVNHFSLEIDDMHAARELLKRRGGYDDIRLRTAVGNNRHWLLHIFDPDGTRAELMSKETLPAGVPSFSVMPPGPPASPILATQRGVYPWP